MLYISFVKIMFGYVNGLGNFVSLFLFTDKGNINDKIVRQFIVITLIKT